MRRAVVHAEVRDILSTGTLRGDCCRDRERNEESYSCDVEDEHQYDDDDSDREDLVSGWQ
jgi:hypothetical protein